MIYKFGSFVLLVIINHKLLYHTLNLKLYINSYYSFIDLLTITKNQINATPKRACPSPAI